MSPPAWSARDEWAPRALPRSAAQFTQAALCATLFGLGAQAAAPAPLAAQALGPPAHLAAPALGAPPPLEAPIGFRTPAGPGPRRLWADAPRPVDGVGAITAQQAERVSPILATATSMAIPGMGQLLLGQRRWAAYAALELGGWLVHLDRLRQGRRFRATYRDLAWAGARGMPNPREESAWAYYEALGSWLRSGSYDLDDARAGLQPETDADSYNGAIWSLAQDIYLPEGASPDHPAYAKALDYYQQRAIRPGFLWDWSGREDSQVVYRELIHKSDEALRTASVVLGAVVANHLFAAVDAFVSSRLGGPAPVSAAVGLRSFPGGTGLEWRVEVRR